MGWFDDQIKQRLRADDEAFSESFSAMARAVMGRGEAAKTLDERRKTRDAVEEILKYYHVKSAELPDAELDVNEQLDTLLRPSGVTRREVSLEGAWYRSAAGAFLGTVKGGGVVALLPCGLSGYAYFDYQTGKRVRLNKRTAKRLEREAVCFYRPLPAKKLTVKDLLIYIVSSLQPADYVVAGASVLAVTLVGCLLPALNNVIFSDLIVSGDMTLYGAVAVALVCVTLSGLLIETARDVIAQRIQTKTGVAVQAASMMRVLSLPAGFFKEYGSGELSSRVQSIGSLCGMLTDAILTTGLSSLFSLIYIAQIFAYAPALVLPALLVTLVSLGFSVAFSLVQMKLSLRAMTLGAQNESVCYALIGGIQKLKLAGAEKRAFAKWADGYQKRAKLLYDPPLFIKLSGVITAAVSMLGTIAMYYFAVQSRVSVADYFSFNAAYGMVSGAFAALGGIALTAANIKPTLEMVKPILDAVPETSGGKRAVTRLSGAVELSGVSFRYAEDMPMILDSLSLKIRAGQYVAIVGRTGCGKSTLARLLMGFETPDKGAIYYDGADIQSLDVKSLRRRIGVVMQNGKLFSGDIFSNITISAPWLTLKEAWEAAEIAGIAQDIRDMPMGMFTLVTEGSGGLSGGQRQRLMIARAVASKPKLLILDEATSALDNLTQRAVTEALGRMKCTRIVIAHRLSTIKECDRILVLDQGRIAEEGTYRELIEKNGRFAELVARQRLDNEA